MALADAVTHRFFKRPTASTVNRYRVASDRLYDFLFERDYPAWFCNLASTQGGSGPDFSTATRHLKEFVLKMHTGEAYASSTPQWSWDQRMSIGQEHLVKLAQDILASAPPDDTFASQLKSRLELDGYTLAEDRLVPPEAEVLDVQEQVGVLQSLYRDLALDGEQTTFHHLSLSEEHYTAGRWDDSISNSRKFLEAVLRASASSHATHTSGETLPPDEAERPAKVREYLEQAGLLDRNEREAVGSIYGLLSATGGHPYMAQNDQARLLRHLALTVSQFVMLRLRGSIAPPQPHGRSP